MDDFSSLSDQEIAEELERRKLREFDPHKLEVQPDTKNNSIKPSTLTKRYGDAYLIARATDSIGKVFKTIGVVLAVVILLGGFIGADKLGAGALILAGVIGVVVGVLFYLLGVLVSAQGQILMATLDTAVNSSSFLNDEQKARIMSI